MVEPADSYSFSDLIALKPIVKLRKNRIPNQQISRAVDALRRKLPRIKQPLSELRIVSDGRTITVKMSGEKMEAISGQMLFDFETAELSVKMLPARKNEAASNALRDAEACFQKG